ncbi:hypothetical protein Tco_0468945 [Tanacetum coccineum]
MRSGLHGGHAIVQVAQGEIFLILLLIAQAVLEEVHLGGQCLSLGSASLWTILIRSQTDSFSGVGPMIMVGSLRFYHHWNFISRAFNDLRHFNLEFCPSVDSNDMRNLASNLYVFAYVSIAAGFAIFLGEWSMNDRRHVFGSALLRSNIPSWENEVWLVSIRYGFQTSKKTFVVVEGVWYAFGVLFIGMVKEVRAAAKIAMTKGGLVTKKPARWAKVEKEMRSVQAKSMAVQIVHTSVLPVESKHTKDDFPKLGAPTRLELVPLSLTYRHAHTFLESLNETSFLKFFNFNTSPLQEGRAVSE